MISAIIMASGFSKRMKKNKLFLEYKGKTLIQRTIDTVLECDFSQIILVARENKILELGEKSGLITVENKNAHLGISESIKLGLSYTDKCDGYIFFTVDQPLVNETIIKSLLHLFDESKKHIIVPKYKGIKGSPVIFPEKFKKDLMKLEGDIGGKVIIRKNFEQVRFLEIEDERIIFDIDTKEDYEKILDWDGQHI
ncbi:molybdenum cofactor cytidylyltransferase [Alkalibaculum sporogenes]|nr:molybdenum cofactor cytidylyltransferase [Alkalibaculum sporogenes]